MIPRSSNVGTAYEAATPWEEGTHHMVAFDATGSPRWSVPGYTPQIATADGGVIATTEDGSAAAFDQNGNATGQMASFLTQSWLAHTYQVGSIDSLLAIPYYIANSFGPWAFANASGNRASVNADRFPSLDHCTSTPGCIGPYEAVYNALDDLVRRLRERTVGEKAQSEIFDKIGTDSKGNPVTTANFILYLTGKRPEFYNGLRSTYCYDALAPQDDNAFCHWWAVSWLVTSVREYLESDADTDAVAGTPSDPLRVFFRPSAILHSSSGKNRGNEGTIFHEALHGLTGRQDEQIIEDLGYVPYSQPSCRITMHIQLKVLSYSLGLDPTVAACP
jgi:hypothetical protein